MTRSALLIAAALVLSGCETPTAPASSSCFTGFLGGVGGNGCSWSFDPPPRVGSATGDVWIGPEAADDSTAIRIVGVNLDDHSEIVARGEFNRWGYAFTFYSDFWMGWYCYSAVVALHPNGLRSEAMPAYEALSGPCEGDMPGPDVHLPAGEPPVTIWGHVHRAERGYLEFYAPSDTINAVYSEWFDQSLSWESPDANYNQPQYVTTVGLQPGDEIPDGFCDWLVRARDHNGNTSELRPMVSGEPETCGGTMYGATALVVGS